MFTKFSPAKKFRALVNKVMNKSSSSSSANTVMVNADRALPAPGKYAVLVGCNYPDTENELNGCVNDVKRMEKTLLSRFGFSQDNIEILIDTDTVHKQPNGKNIRDSLEQLVSKASPGDILYFHYSGHGTRIKRAGDETGYDECIVPTDFNLIKDDDFRTLVNKVPSGASFIIVSDSCHSGGLIDKGKEQIGPHKSRNTDKKAASSVKVKFLAPEIILEVLKERSGDKTLQLSNVNEAVFKVFGDRASPSIKKSASFSVLASPKPKDGDTKDDSVKSTPELEETMEVEASEEGNLGSEVKVKVDPDMGILLSGCQSNETSADACPTGNLSEAFGAFSDSIQKVLAAHPTPITNKELIIKCRKLLTQNDYSQHPCLYCSDSSAKAFFIGQTPK